jgi:uncharacterized membrane protein (UPF0182 family)
MEYIDQGTRRRMRWSWALLLVLLVFVFGRGVASFVIEFQWWKEMGQLSTWGRMLAYGYTPVAAATLLAFCGLWFAHARGMKSAGTRLGEHPLYARLSTVALLVVGGILASATVDGWTVVRFVGSLGSGAGQGWRDPVFGRVLSFYFFELPLLGLLLRFILVTSLASAILFWLTARGWGLRQAVQHQEGETAWALDVSRMDLTTALEARFFRAAAALFLVALAARFLLGRYNQLFDDHTSLVGVDWVSENVTLPLLWLCAVTSLAAAAGVLFRRLRWALAFPAALAVYALLPPLITALYVRPSEITIQTSYIVRHIQATRAAYGLSRHLHEMDFAASPEAPIDPARHHAIFDNVRLWDWRAFHDTVTQIQALRPYYVFHATDVDRYMLDGQLRQVMVTPRELDVTQLPGDARSRWINPHFIYTHGYGLVMAEAARITEDGLPRLLIENAPPEVMTRSLRLVRPELYYSELTHEPIFVRTGQPEFNYPSGAGNQYSRYQGKGGIPMGSPLMRVAAAVSTGDWNILLTSYLQPQSRMIIRRNILARLSALAEFLSWDPDPYLVVTNEGRLVWMVDGYTTSDAHPYSKAFSVGEIGSINYIRNSVKATVDAYDGTVRLYVFDEQDPVLQAYRNLLPALFQPESAMPADLRAHARYPELLFRLQAEVYRTFHMTNPEAFFNKEDMWDIARNLYGPSGNPETVAPTYVVASLPGQDSPEFLLLTTFTPRNKDNLIGLMAARCDGESLGEMIVLQLSKQQLVFGPMQIEARISQDQNISKDLTLWNQQGSQVLRGQMLVLPVDDTFIYIEPIYLQASEARMPQLKRVVLAMGNRLIYAGTYEQALSELASTEAAPAVPSGVQPSPPPESKASEAGALEQVREHWRKYRDLIGQGRFAEAGQELDTIGSLLASTPQQKR